MIKNCPISIVRTANGYVVEPRNTDTGILAWNDTYVFNELRHVFEFLERHFPSLMSEPTEK